MRLEPVSPEDLAQIKRIITDEPVFQAPDIDTYIEKRLPDSTIYMYKENGEIAAFLFALKTGFTRHSITTPASYFNYMYTAEKFRHQGTMASLIQAAREGEKEIITLFPHDIKYFASRGFYVSTHSLGFFLDTDREYTKDEERLDSYRMVYANCTDQNGALDRDDVCWDLLLRRYDLIEEESCDGNAYALVHNGFAIETFAEGEDVAMKLLDRMKEHGVKKMMCLSDSPFAYMIDQPSLMIPNGMSSEKKICSAVFIQNQF